MHTNISRKQNQGQTHSKNNAVVKSFVWVMFVCVSMTLSGCGNKGDLYLPEKDDTKKQASTAGVDQSKP